MSFPINIDPRTESGISNNPFTNRPIEDSTPAEKEQLNETMIAKDERAVETVEKTGFWTDLREAIQRFIESIQGGKAL